MFPGLQGGLGKRNSRLFFTSYEVGLVCVWVTPWLLPPTSDRHH